ncbi:hypothetical protein [Labrys sp. ZIDIC5]|jgi:hypothetical protein|uniref:hypothetical protein n=1 Tax=Labrys sedimenti TaxID=3106036 RepID=UPI002ACA1F25|nr:hypothetical protein [Labrys sp. ZIDIC5]MDZ5454630.1 hypothetical protein [Labrys sp. ZIDIC5]
MPSFVRWKTPVLVAVVAIAFLASWIVLSPYRSACTTEVVAAEQAMRASDQELRTVSVTDKAAICQVYRRRVDALKTAAPVMRRCGTAQLNPDADWSARVTELGFYQGLVAQQCG